MKEDCHANIGEMEELKAQENLKKGSKGGNMLINKHMKKYLFIFQAT